MEAARSASKPGLSINRGIKTSFVLAPLIVAVVTIVRFHVSLRYGGYVHQDDSPVNVSPRSNVSRQEEHEVNTSTNDRFDDECFRARNDTVPLSRYGKLKRPFVNLGFPKMGTTSLHSFFACAGYRAMHYRCLRRQELAGRTDASCSECVTQSIEEGNANPFAKCGTADAYTQLDNGSWGNFPQVEYLEEIVRGMPNGTFLLPFRSVRKWYHSMTHWPPENEFGPHMSDGLRAANMTGFPSGVGNNIEEFGDWYCNHVKRVRSVVERNPSQTLVEIDIENPSMSSYMSDVFDIDETCWGHVNVNAKLHPEHDKNQSTPDVPWFVAGNMCLRGKTKMRLKNTDTLPVIPGLPAWMFIDNRTCSGM